MSTTSRRSCGSAGSGVARRAVQHTAAPEDRDARGLQPLLHPEPASRTRSRAVHARVLRPKRRDRRLRAQPKWWGKRASWTAGCSARWSHRRGSTRSATANSTRPAWVARIHGRRLPRCPISTSECRRPFDDPAGPQSRDTHPARHPGARGDFPRPRPRYLGAHPLHRPGLQRGSAGVIPAVPVPAEVSETTWAGSGPMTRTGHDNSSTKPGGAPTRRAFGDAPASSCR